MNNKDCRLDLVLAYLLSIFEILVILFVLCSYRFSPVEGINRFLSSSAGMMCIIALFSILVTGSYLIRHIRRLPAPLKRRTSLTLSLNLVTLLMTVIAGEVSLRVLHELSMRIPNLHVDFPMLRNWERTSGEFLAVLNSPIPPYYDFDPELGWTIGKNRYSQNGLYASSSEGLRSACPGESVLSWSKVALRQTDIQSDPVRVALIGDSFTFGAEVAYEETWAHRVSLLLGPRYELINFGVIGYSVNQMRMKYVRDVRALHPDLVVVGLISHDFLRDTFIYHFLGFPDALTLPYARPRPLLRNGRLELLNTPLPTPSQIFATSSVHDLPHLELDMNYNFLEWERAPWWLFQRSFLFRTLTAWPPGQPEARRRVFTREQHALGKAVLHTLADSIHKAGSVPLILFFPTMMELADSPNISGPPPSPYATTLLDELGLPYEDMTACVRTVSPEHRFAPNGHYSAETNAALASCLPDIVRKRMSQTRPHQAVLARQH